MLDAMFRSDSPRFHTWEGQKLQQNFQIKYPQGLKSKLSSASPCARHELTFNYNHFEFGRRSGAVVAFREERKIDRFLAVFAKSGALVTLEKMTCPGRDPTSRQVTTGTGASRKKKKGGE